MAGGNASIVTLGQEYLLFLPPTACYEAETILIATSPPAPESQTVLPLPAHRFQK